MRHYLVLLALALPGRQDLQEPPPTSRPAALAVIVHKDSEVTDLKLEELRAIVTMERQFWSAGHRIQLLLRPSKCEEMQTLLQRVYRMAEDELRRMWVQKLFEGRIPAVPTTVKLGAKAVATVEQSPNAISFVPLNEVTANVRVLSIDGKKPGEAGYPLTAGGK